MYRSTDEPSWAFVFERDDIPLRLQPGLLPAEVNTIATSANLLCLCRKTCARLNQACGLPRSLASLGTADEAVLAAGANLKKMPASANPFQPNTQNNQEPHPHGFDYGEAERTPKFTS